MQIFKIIGLLFGALALGACAYLKAPVFSTEEGAIRGYDTVAYHVEGQARRGKPDISAEHRGATWHFASEENRSLFVREPERFAPQYGGYCAYGMSRDYVVSIDPQAWHLVDGKLYLNHSPGVRKTWLEDIPAYVNKADDNWGHKTRKAGFD